MLKLYRMLPQSEEGIQWNKVTWYSKASAVLLFVGLVCGAFFFGEWYHEQRALENGLSTQQNSATYKQGFYGEIPSWWSTYSGSDTLLANTLQDLSSPSALAYSFAPDGIRFGDGSFEQVDFYYVSEGVVKDLLTQAVANRYSVTNEIVGGYESKVIYYPTDNGQVTKNGPGGADYIIGYPVGSFYYPNFLLMRNWSRGDQEFESGFQHYLQTASFQTQG